MDIDFSNSDIEYLGSSKAPDLEKITSLKPDLIIGLNRHIKIKKQLSKIAPVVIIELNGDWMNTYKVIADATSKTRTFKKKLSRYKKQIKSLKRKYKRPSSISVSVIRSSKDEFSVERDNFIQKVLDDIGFKHPKGMKQVERGEDGKDFGIEAIKQFNTTYILDMYSPHKGETEKSKMSSKSAEAIKTFYNCWKKRTIFYS